MSSWGNNDNAANAPYWAVNSTITHTTDSERHATPNAANVAYLYANTSADAYITGQTIGLFGVDAQEAAVDHTVTHPGWVLRTTGSGGRAGRVQNEVLIALSGMSADGGDGDNQTYANVSIALTNLSNGSVVANASFANVITFSTTASLTGNTAARLTYQWQYLNGGTWTNLGSNTSSIHYNGKTSATLYAIPADTAASGTKYRVVVAAPDEGVSTYSSNAVITIS